MNALCLMSLKPIDMRHIPLCDELQISTRLCFCLRKLVLEDNQVWPNLTNTIYHHRFRGTRSEDVSLASVDGPRLIRMLPT